MFAPGHPGAHVQLEPIHSNCKGRVCMWDSNLNIFEALVCRQVETLARTQDSVNELPDELKESKAVIMTVPQAKGVNV